MAVDKSSVAPPSQGYVTMSKIHKTGSHSLSPQDRFEILNSLSQKKPSLKVLQHLSVYEEIIAIFSFLIFPGCIIWCPLVLAILVHHSFYASYTWIALFTSAVVILTCFPHSRSDVLLRSKLVSILFKYSSLDYAWEAPLSLGRPYMLICPPHGVMPVANLLILLSFRSVWGFDFYGLTANAALTLPVMRQIMLWIGCKSATRESAKQLLDSGLSIGISPGGVAEIFDVNNHDEVIFIKSRTGFVKLALMTGTPLVPCYSFGNTKLFSCWYDGKNYMRNLSRRLGFGVVLVWGRFGLPIIHREPLLIVTGKPIEVPLEIDPSPESVQKYLEIFVNELQELFEKYKIVYGWENRKLVIR